jgi:hypothetical protein
VLTPVKITPVAVSLESIRQKMELLGITEDEVDESVQWARK